MCLKNEFESRGSIKQPKTHKLSEEEINEINNIVQEQKPNNLNFNHSLNVWMGTNELSNNEIGKNFENNTFICSFVNQIFTIKE